jgi:hypothetical protein
MTGWHVLLILVAILVAIYVFFVDDSGSVR